MLDDFISRWPWFVAAIGVGVATAVFVGPDPHRRYPARWLVWISAAAAAGVVAVALGAIQGCVALYVVVGGACFAAFLVGASAGGGARGVFGAHERLAVGLVPLAVLWVVAGWPQTERISTTFKPLIGNFPDTDHGDETSATPPPSAAASSELAAIPVNAPVGDLDAAACERALDAVAKAQPVAFNRTHATIHRDAASALDKAAEVIRRCPEVSIDVIGFDDGDGVNAALALRRARAAERYLRAEGVGGRKLAAGVADPRAKRPGAGAIGYVLRSSRMR